MLGNINNFGNGNGKVNNANPHAHHNNIGKGKDVFEFKKPEPFVDPRDTVSKDKYAPKYHDKKHDQLIIEDKGKTDEDKNIQLSEAAQNLLEELRKQFGNVDFIVAKFSTDEEAQEYLKTGKGEYNCVLTPALLEKMAADAEVRAKYEGVITNAIGDLKEIKQKAEPETAEIVNNYGVSVNSEGEVKYYAVLKDGLPDFAYEDLNSAKMVKANTIEQLLAILNDIAERIRAEKEKNPDPDDEIIIEAPPAEPVESPEVSEGVDAHMDFTA